MTARIRDRFARCKQDGRAALIGYLTAFDPDKDASRDRIFAACEAGLDLLELGVPFSDPTADGPSIQAAMVRALASGARLSKVLELAAEVRARFDLPIVVFSYCNPLWQMGADALVPACKAADIDGLLVVDLPLDCSAPLHEPARAAGLDWIGLVAPTTSPDRAKTIAAASSGFVYLVSLRGVTGAKAIGSNQEIADKVALLRASTTLPIAVGFGIRTPEQAKSLLDDTRADAVIVGSALIDAAQVGTASLRSLVQSLRQAL